MTHSCGDCASGAPCHNCGGNISRSHPAYQALDWGLRSIEPGSDPFWVSAKVSNTLHDAPSRADSPEWRAMESMVQRAQAIAIVQEQGQNAIGQMFGAWQLQSQVVSGNSGGFVEATWRHWPPRGSKVPTEPEKRIMRVNAPKEPVKGGGAGCCPHLDYPEEIEDPLVGPTQLIARAGGGEPALGASVEVGFRFHALYDPRSRKPECECSCCEFYQLVIKDKLTRYGTDGKPTGQEANVKFSDGMDFAAGHEDHCDFLIYDPTAVDPETGETVYWRVETHSRLWMPAAKGWVKGEDWDGPYCYGDNGRPRHPPKKNGHGVPPKIEPPRSRIGECFIKSLDIPRVSAPVGLTLWEWESWGVVFDTCHQVVKRVSYVAWAVMVSVPSTLGAQGSVVDSNTSSSAGEVDVSSLGGLSGGAAEGPVMGAD